MTTIPANDHHLRTTPPKKKLTFPGEQTQTRYLLARVLVLDTQAEVHATNSVGMVTAAALVALSSTFGLTIVSAAVSEVDKITKWLRTRRHHNAPDFPPHPNPTTC